MRDLLLSDLDSNQDKQSQNLLCYRYTIGQFRIVDCKIIKIILSKKYYFSLYEL